MFKYRSLIFQKHYYILFKIICDCSWSKSGIWNYYLCFTIGTREFKAKTCLDLLRWVLLVSCLLLLLLIRAETYKYLSQNEEIDIPVMKVFLRPGHEGKSVVELVSRLIVLSLLQGKHTDKMQIHRNLPVLGKKSWVLCFIPCS